MQRSRTCKWSLLERLPEPRRGKMRILCLLKVFNLNNIGMDKCLHVPLFPPVMTIHLSSIFELAPWDALKSRNLSYWWNLGRKPSWQDEVISEEMGERRKERNFKYTYIVCNCDIMAIDQVTCISFATLSDVRGLYWFYFSSSILYFSMSHGNDVTD